MKKLSLLDRVFVMASTTLEKEWWESRDFETPLFHTCIDSNKDTGIYISITDFHCGGCENKCLCDTLEDAREDTCKYEKFYREESLLALCYVVHITKGYSAKNKITKEYISRNFKCTGNEDYKELYDILKTIPDLQEKY